jgi:Leucine-rich repeat (LRR) protein/GTPase SAR1 family protein
MVRYGDYEQAVQRIGVAWQEEKIELDLSDLRLDELPESLRKITQLQSLDLSFNQLTALPDWIGQLSNLQELYLYNNRLTTLPDSISQLSSLKELKLSSNRLTMLPESLGQLFNLQKLELSSNQLTILPDYLGQLSSLQELELSENQLTTLPKSLGKLSLLQGLYLYRNRLTTLPEWIGQLFNLQRLELSSNQLTTLPESLGQLSNLQRLNLSSNPLMTLPEWIGKLSSLQEFYPYNNQLTLLPESLGKLSSLQKLVLSFNQLTTLPESLGQLSSLQEIELSGNQLMTLPEWIGQLPRLQRLDLHNNPLSPELAAAYEQGFDAVKAYLRAKAEDQIVLNEAKLILVGEGEVGKSCLLGALRGDAWVEGRLTTHGIEIKPLLVTAPGSVTEITLNGWDFGGQRVSRPTHQLFFSAPAVYLVVWKPREGPQQGFVKEWITLIKHREPDAKVLVVATHGGPGQRQPDIDRQELIDLFGSDTVVGFFHVDSKLNESNQNCTEIEELRDAIAKIAAALPEMGRSVPGKWQRAWETLRTSDKPYLPYGDVISLCAEQGIDEQQAELFIRISHRLGHLTHYDKDQSLRNIVILKPDWLAEAISYVLDDKTTRDRNGLVEFNHLSQLWSNPFEGKETYLEAVHPVFLRLMERFDLSYRVVLDPTKPSTTSLIAQLVPDNRPAQLPNWGEQPEAGDRQQIQICRIVDGRGQLANAEGLFYQLIVRLHKYSLGRANYENAVHWQRGLMLDNDYNGRALLEHIGTDVKITVRAAYPERFLSYLTQEVQWLVENFWEGLRCNIMVSCVEPCGMDAPGHGLFEVQKLIESKKKNRDEYPCPISGCDEWQNIDQLLNNASMAPSQAIGIEEFQNVVKDELKGIRSDLVTLDNRAKGRFQALSQGQRILLSKGEKQFNDLMQRLTDEAKDGPRLFSFKPVDPGFFDRPKWISAKFQVTLWCEHSHQPLPALNRDSKLGVYELDLPREWLVKAAPLLKIMSVTLGLILPVASSAIKFKMDDTTYKGIEEQLDLGQKSLEFALKGSDLAVNSQSKSATPNLEHGEAICAQGSVLRSLHTLLKDKDPRFGGLERVENKRREFLWVHAQFVDEY